MYQISQTSFNPDTADQPWQPTFLYTANSADYRGDAAMADGKFSELHISRPPTLRPETAPNFLTFTREYTAK